MSLFRTRIRTWMVWVVGVVPLVAFSSPARAQFGLAVSGVGPINRSMGGASTAAPLDSAGAIYWNPATITGLAQSEMEFGTGFLIPRTTITSRVGAGALGSGLPSSTMHGTTGGNNGLFILPTIGLVYTPKDSPVTYGFGVFEIGGFGVNYPVSPTNPILNPQLPYGRGVGPLYTQLQLFQFTPTAALKLSDTLSVGLAANIDYGLLSANPGLFTSPSLVNSPTGPGPNYPFATQGRSRGGGGFQAGVYWTPDEFWSFGASFKSTQWFERYTYNSVNAANGNPSNPNLNLDFPLIVSVGTAYKGFDRWLLAADFRFLDYRDTDGFRHTGFDETGRLRGLGWQNVFALGTGAQYQATDALTLRIGYTFSTNPIGGMLTTINLGSPTIITNSLSLGGSYNVTENFKLSLAWAHDFQNSISGPIVEPFLGALPHTSVRTAATADTVLIGATVSF